MVQIALRTLMECLHLLSMILDSINYLLLEIDWE